MIAHIIINEMQFESETRNNSLLTKNFSIFFRDG